MKENRVDTGYYWNGLGGMLEMILKRFSKV